MSGLSEQLRLLGVRLGVRDLSPPQPRPRYVYPIEQVVDGRFQDTPYGPVFVTEMSWPVGYRYGRMTLVPELGLHALAAWAQDRRLAECAPEHLIFLDTETTGLAGGTGTYTFLIGLGAYQGNRFRLVQFFMRDPIEEAAQLTVVQEFLQQCRALVTFNGKAFDIPLLHARFVTNGLSSPVHNVPNLDLLLLARRLWRDRLPSRALSSLEQHILEAQRDEQDVPGWMIPALYFDYLRTGDARSLRRVFYHNAMDILALAALLGRQAQLLEQPGAVDLEHGVDCVALADLLCELGRAQEAAHLYRAALARGLPESMRWPVVGRLARLERRLGNLAAALELWQAAAEERQPVACVELAKYYEHQARDYVHAAHWTQVALDLVAVLPMAPQLRQRWVAELRHRQARLERRQGILDKNLADATMAANSEPT